MPATLRIVVDLTEDDVAMVEEQRGEMSQGEFVLEALRAEIYRRRDEADVRAYVESYRCEPETDDEIAMGAQLAALALADEPWDE